MSITAALGGVIGYQPGAGREQPAQKHLSIARAQIAAELPPVGYKVRSSGSGQTLPKVPWIAVLDPDVTKTAQSGLYVVYLYDVAIKHVYLSMNQGATAHRHHYVESRPIGVGIDAAALAEVKAETAAIRSLLDPALMKDTESDIHLGSTLYLPRAYEAGNIAAIGYDLSALPPEPQLRDDLNRFLVLYGESVASRQVAVASHPDKFNVPAPPPEGDGTSGTVFQPKDSGDYFAWIKAHTQRRTRKHEELVNSFAKYAQGKGWHASTKGMHPRDLVLDKDGKHLLVEAKTVRANSEFAVREAIGQLFAYEYLYYPSASTSKVALFASPVGDLWVKLLGQLSIDCIWLEGSEWRSSGANVNWV
jgi:hypothetical protein